MRELKDRAALWRGSTRVGLAALVLGMALMFAPEQMEAMSHRLDAAVALLIGAYGLWTRGKPPGGEP